MTRLLRQITVWGRVQGVSFRVATREKAEALGITGIVQNLPDGAVYIEAEGTDEQLTALERWCHQGPPRARVTEVVVQNAPVKNYVGFVIRRE
ncbi:MAG: acylphosphatase [Cyclobacteriaceae bacterium]|nr:acylphosphatase [Cyclobacteriaceae bacterium]